MKFKTAVGRWVSCILTSPIIQSTDLDYVEKSLPQWRPYGTTKGYETGGVWVSSPLGIINGFLPKIGLLLVSEQPTDVTETAGWKIRLRKYKDVIFNKEDSK